MPGIFSIPGLSWRLCPRYRPGPGLITTVLLFLSPMFFPIAALAAHLQNVALLNPLTAPVEQPNKALLEHSTPDWRLRFTYTAASLVVACFGYAWAQRTRRGVSDVL